MLYWHNTELCIPVSLAILQCIKLPKPNYAATNPQIPNDKLKPCLSAAAGVGKTLQHTQRVSHFQDVCKQQLIPSPGGECTMLSFFEALVERLFCAHWLSSRFSDSRVLEIKGETCTNSTYGKIRKTPRMHEDWEGSTTDVPSHPWECSALTRIKLTCLSPDHLRNRPSVSGKLQRIQSTKPSHRG